MAYPTTKDMRQLLIERVNKLSEEEKQFISVVGYYADTILNHAVHYYNNNQQDTSVFNGKEDWFGTTPCSDIGTTNGQGQDGESRDKIKGSRCGY